MKEVLKQRWSSLAPSQKKKLIILLTLAAFFICTIPFYMSREAKTKKQPVEKKETYVFDFGKGNFLEEHWVVRATRDLEKQKKTISELEERIAELQKQLLEKELQPPQPQRKEEKKEEQEKEKFPPPPYPPQVHVQPAKPEKVPDYIIVVSAKRIIPEKKQKEEEETEISYGYIPSGSFVRGVLLTGVDAPTGNVGKTNPYPVLIRLLDLSFLPNRVRFDVKDCFVTGEAYGELSTERANIRTDMLSCITHDRHIIDMPVKGYVVDIDGKVGLAGHPVTKQGALIARSLIAGFLEGVGEAFRVSSMVVAVSPLGTTTQVMPETSEILRAGIGGGISKAAEELAKFYMDLARQMFPVIEIGSNRPLHVVFLKGIELKFKKYLEGSAYALNVY